MNFKNRLFNGVALSLLPLFSSAATYEWSSGYAQGTEQYHIDDGNGNSLLISCPGDQPRAASATMTTKGLDYHSPRITQNQGMIEMSFVIDGVQFDDPFNTSCNACESNFTNAFWPALLKANNLFVHADGYQIRFTTQGLRKVLEPLDAPSNMCLTESQAFARANQTFAPAQDNTPKLPAGFTNRAVIDDPDGYSNIRSQKNAKSQIVSKITQGEQFFTYMQDGNWWQVRTQQGKIGYMHVSRIRLLD